MDISYHTVSGNLDTTRGYGTAGFKVVTSLQELGHRVPFDSPEAPVQISFVQPTHYNFHPGQYKIGFTPWESTDLPDGWRESFNECDEVWATSDWTADVYRANGVTVPVKTYLHGLDNKWQPVVRKRGEVVKFLHMGEPALRKGGQMAIDAFRKAFGDRTDVHLTIKAYFSHYLRVWEDGVPIEPEYSRMNNVTVITDSLHPGELRALYADHDVMVYPSYGEGFGFIPLQALGTGMPVICTDAWAPYKDYLGPLALSGSWNRSIWSLHPGDVYYPDYDMLIDLMKYARDNIDWLHKVYYDQAPAVHAEYDWLRLTEEAFAPIVKRFS